jgi:hypothetical protein
LIITAPDAYPADGHYYIYGPSCPNPPHSATVKVTATDADDAVSGVTLFYWPGGSGVLSTSMVKSDSNTWVGTIDAQDSWSVGQINYWVQAMDSHGNQSPVFDHSNSYILNKGDCFL